MYKIKEYLKLIRVKHYIKNLLIFLPLVFSGNFFYVDILKKVFISFISFSFIASVVYIINDIKDIEKDKLHDTKKNRPLAKGTIPVNQAIIISIILFICAIILNIIFLNTKSLIIMLLYFIMNIGYSFKLKNIPILDLLILTFGFVLRIIYGGISIDITISNWLYLTIMSMAFYLSIGKRRGEKNLNTRKVLEYYSKEFLDKFMYMYLCMTIVFYSLWAMDNSVCHYSNLLIWSVPIVLAICMRYSMIVEGKSDGDPTEVFLKDKALIVLCLIYVLYIMGIFYF